MESFFRTCSTGVSNYLLVLIFKKIVLIFNSCAKSCAKFIVWNTEQKQQRLKVQVNYDDSNFFQFQAAHDGGCDQDVDLAHFVHQHVEQRGRAYGDG